MENKTHWLANPNKNYFGHWDLPNGEDLILTIDSAQWEDVKNPQNNQTESKRVVRFKEKDIKPLIVNQTNATSILVATGCRFMEDSVGQKIQLYVGSTRDHRAKVDIDCVRIRQVKPELPELKPEDTGNWNIIKQALNNGYTIDQIRTKWKISNENETKLNNEIS